MKARVGNTLGYPSIPQWVGAFMNEMDTRIATPILYESNIYVQRSEWGNNSNPHWHRLLFSESLSKYFNDLREKFSNDVADRIATYQECPENDKSKFEEEILSLFEA